jgi:manganese/zinc/iron transport system permease protein
MAPETSMSMVERMISPFVWGGSLEMYWPILVQGSLVSVALGVLGCFLVVRGMSLLGDALSHCVLPGIVVGFWIGGSLSSPWILVGATAVGLVASLLIRGVHTHSRVKEDASLGVVFTAMFAAGVLMINLTASGSDLDPGCVLYGAIEHFVLDQSGILPMAIVAGLVMGGVVVFYRVLLVVTFDPQLAVALGLPATVVSLGMMAALSLTLVASFEAVGAILAVALVITPGATARLWTDRMPVMLFLAGMHGVVSAVAGYWLSHPAVMDTNAAGAMTVVGFGLFCVSYLVAPRHGMGLKLWQRLRLRRQVLAENVIKALVDLREARRPVAMSTMAEELRCSPWLAGRSVKLARGFGWVTEGGLALTSAGQRRAERVRRAHELWEQYLQTKVGLAADHVHDAAEWIEHHLSDDKLELIDVEVKEAAK